MPPQNLQSFLYSYFVVPLKALGEVWSGFIIKHNTLPQAREGFSKDLCCHLTKDFGGCESHLVYVTHWARRSWVNTQLSMGMYQNEIFTFGQRQELKGNMQGLNCFSHKPTSIRTRSTDFTTTTTFFFFF